MARELTRRAARAELRQMVASQGKLGLVNLLPVPHDAARFNQWGDDLNTFLVVSHNIDGTLKATGSLPSGGAAGQVLVKQSSADGDALWISPALPSTAIPLPNSGNGDPGVATKFSREDHVHPASGGALALPALQVAVPSSPIAGQLIVGGIGVPTVQSLNNNPTSGQVVTNIYPFYLTNPLPASYVGVGFGNTGSGADVSVGLAIWDNLPDAGGVPRPGTVLFGGSVGSTSGAGSITGSAGLHWNFTATTVSLQADTIYWAVPYARAGVTGPQCIAMNSPTPLLVTDTGLAYTRFCLVGNAAPPNINGTGATSSLNGSTYIPLVFKVA